MLNKARGNCIKVIRFRIRNSSDSICPESMIVYAMCTNNNMNEQENMLFFLEGSKSALAMLVVLDSSMASHREHNINSTFHRS